MCFKVCMQTVFDVKCSKMKNQLDFPLYIFSTCVYEVISHFLCSVMQHILISYNM